MRALLRAAPSVKPCIQILDKQPAHPVHGHHMRAVQLDKVPPQPLQFRYCHTSGRQLQCLFLPPSAHTHPHTDGRTYHATPWHGYRLPPPFAAALHHQRHYLLCSFAQLVQIVALRCRFLCACHQQHAQTKGREGSRPARWPDWP